MEEHRAVANAMGNIQEAASYYMADRQREAEEELKKVKEQGYSENSKEYKTAEQAVKDWEIGGSQKQTIDTVTAVVGAVLGGGSAGQIGVAALSPTANNLIHEATKDDKTKITNILAHAVLGAIEAKAGGASAASGAVAAAGAEMIANTIAKEFYGVDGVNRTIDSLTNDEKENILTLSQLGSAIAGGVTGDSGYAAAVSGEIGKRAVEYNNFQLAAKGCLQISYCRQAVAKKILEFTALGVTSIAISTNKPNIRLSIDSDGNIHRFTKNKNEPNGAYHWTGSTGDKANPMSSGRELRDFNSEIKILKGGLK